MGSDDAYMELALAEARAAAAAGEVPVGAVLVDLNTGQVLARAGNGPIARHDPTAHAEILVLREAARKRKNYRLLDSALYVTLEPCAMCAAALSLARVSRLVYGAADPKGGAVAHGARFFTQPTCHHRPAVAAGVGAEAAAALLKNFFRDRR